MKRDSIEIEAMAMGNSTSTDTVEERFIVFVAGGKCPVTGFENLSRAERLALRFAGLLNVRMEVFDSLKETCYFIEPAEAKGL